MNHHLSKAMSKIKFRIRFCVAFKHIFLYQILFSIFHAIFTPIVATAQTTASKSTIVTLEIAGTPAVVWMVGIIGIALTLSAIYSFFLSYYERSEAKRKETEPLRHLYRSGKDFGG